MILAMANYSILRYKKVNSDNENIIFAVPPPRITYFLTDFVIYKLHTLSLCSAWKSILVLHILVL